MNSIRKSITGAVLAGGLLLGAPVLATLAAAPASADGNVVFQDGNGGGFAFGDDGVVVANGNGGGVAVGNGGVAFGNGNGEGAIITDDGFGFQVGGLQVGVDN